jgi:hypothetical protein
MQSAYGQNHIRLILRPQGNDTTDFQVYLFEHTFRQSHILKSSSVLLPCIPYAVSFKFKKLHIFSQLSRPLLLLHYGVNIRRRPQYPLCASLKIIATNRRNHPRSRTSPTTRPGRSRPPRHDQPEQNHQDERHGPRHRRICGRNRHSVRQCDRRGQLPSHDRLPNAGDGELKLRIAP